MTKRLHLILSRHKNMQTVAVFPFDGLPEVPVGSASAMSYCLDGLNSLPQEDQAIVIAHLCKLYGTNYDKKERGPK